MTVVARLAIRNCPMLVADLLLSGPAPPEYIPDIPTVEEMPASFLPRTGPVPITLRQKIAVLSDDLAVGWAGKYDVARDVVAELKRMNGSQPFMLDSLTRHLDTLPESVRSVLHLVGFVREGGKVGQFGYNSHELPTQVFGKAGLVGSGLEDL